MNYNHNHMHLVLPVKDHKLYCQKPLKDLPKEHHSLRHYLVFLSIFQTLLVMNVGIWIFFQILHDNLTLYLWYDYLIVHIKYAQMLLIKWPNTKWSIFFSIWVFFHEYSRFAGEHGKGEAISLTFLSTTFTRFTDT